MRLTQGLHPGGVELRIVDLATAEFLPWDDVAFGDVHLRGTCIASGSHAAPIRTV